MDAGNITQWPPSVAVPLAAYPDAYPLQGWNQEWQASTAQYSGYGGVSQISAPAYTQYASGTQAAKVWTDQTGALGNIAVMGFDATAQAVVAGDVTLAGLAGGLVTLVAGATYSVTTNVSCAGYSAGPSLAQWKLVTNSGTGVTMKVSTPIAAAGPMAWTFTVPVGTVGAYLSVVNLLGDPQKPVSFSKPAIFAQGSNTAALGYLGSANAVPLRVAAVKMPAYYRKGGWPTPAAYLLKDASTLIFDQSNPDGPSSTGTQVDPATVTTAANLRFLANQGYDPTSGLWVPAMTSGSTTLAFHAVSAATAPYYAPVDDNDAYTYRRAGQDADYVLPSLVFDPGSGSWLYSDDLNAAGITAYTVIMVLSPSNTYNGLGGLWSSAPVAAGGGPDTEADFSAFNYRSVDMAGASLQVTSRGMQPKVVPIGQGVRLHKPTYIAMSFSNTANALYWADTPGSVSANTLALAGLGSAGPLNGSVVLGADAYNGLSLGAFDLFELGIYFGAMTAAQVTREIQLLGQIYG